MILTNVYKLKIQYCILKSLSIKCFSYTAIMLFLYEFFTSRNSSIDIWLCQIDFDNEKFDQNIVFNVSLKKYYISCQNDPNVPLKCFIPLTCLFELA